LNQEELKPIIDAITKEVLNRIEEMKPVAQKPDECHHREKLLLVFTGGTGNLDIVLDELKLLIDKYCFCAIFTPAASKCIGQDKVRQYFDFEEIHEDELYTVLSEVSTVLFPTLTQNTAAKAVCGIRDSIGSEAIACSLLLKKHVIVLSDSIPLRQMPATYANMVGDILKKLGNLGVDICDAKNIRKQFAKPKEDIENEMDTSHLKSEDHEPLQIRENSERVMSIDGKAPVTADVIYNAATSGYSQILLPPRTVVTPLAKDVAKDNNIIVEWMVE